MTMNKMNLSFLQDGDIRNVAYIHSLAFMQTKDREFNNHK